MAKIQSLSFQRLKLSWNGLVCFSPIGCWPPWRPHRALAPMNKDAEGRRKVERSESNWKCGLKGFDNRLEMRSVGPVNQRNRSFGSVYKLFE